jgi:hypothetical protein
VSTSHLQPRDAGWYPDPAGGHGQRWHDGVGWTARTSLGKPMKALGPPFAALADRLTRMLVIVALLNLAGLALAVHSYVSPATVVRANLMAEVKLPTYHLVSYALGGSTLLLVVVAGITWLVWQRRLALAAPGVLRNRPAMHVVWWFVPFANLVMPFRAVTDLWRAYGTARKGAVVSGPPFLVWWLCYLLSGPFGTILLYPGLGGTSLAGVQVVALVQVAGTVLNVVAAGLAVLVVRGLSWQALLVHAG